MVDEENVEVEIMDNNNVQQGTKVFVILQITKNDQ